MLSSSVPHSRLAAWILLAIVAQPAARAADAVEGPASPVTERVVSDGSGFRATLEERGITYALATYNDAVAVVDGGLETGTTYPGLLELTAGFDFDRLLGWHDTTAFVRAIAMYGTDPAEATGALDAPSNIGNPVQTHRLHEAWIERQFSQAALSIRAGVLAVDAEFDVKETAGVFVNGGFGTGIDLSQSGRNGPCVYPTSCLGLRLRWQPSAHTYVQAAVLDGVAGDPDDPHGTHLDLNLHDEGVLALGELGYTRGADEGRFLRAALGVWYYSAEFPDLLEVDAGGDPVRRHMTPGLYALLERELYREPGSPTQGLSGFLRVGLADDDIHQVGRYVSAGLANSGLLPGRDEDVTAFGVSVPINGSKFEKAARRAGTPVDDAELAFELTHWMPLLPWLSVQFDAQYIVNPGTDPAIDDAVLLGLRVQATF